MREVLLILTTLSVVLSQSALADSKRGAKLVDDNCSDCHAASFGGDKAAIYLRADRRVNSHQQLISQVRFCENNLNLTWFDEQIMDVTKHLNQSYYRFDAGK